MMEMNERIKLLALEAFQPINDIASEGIADRYTFDQAWFQMYNQKFAELIVRECLEACSRANEIRHFVPPTQEQVVLSCMREIEEHFGVEHGVLV
jgi:hypothetical protein